MQMAASMWLCMLLLVSGSVKAQQEVLAETSCRHLSTENTRVFFYCELMKVAFHCASNTSDHRQTEESIRERVEPFVGVFIKDHRQQTMTPYFEVFLRHIAKFSAQITKFFKVFSKFAVKLIIKILPQTAEHINAIVFMVILLNMCLNWTETLLIFIFPLCLLEKLGGEICSLGRRVYSFIGSVIRAVRADANDANLAQLANEELHLPRDVMNIVAEYARLPRGPTLCQTRADIVHACAFLPVFGPEHVFELYPFLPLICDYANNPLE
jgi:hypothetical protein